MQCTLEHKSQVVCYQSIYSVQMPTLQVAKHPCQHKIMGMQTSLHCSESCDKEPGKCKYE